MDRYEFKHKGQRCFVTDEGQRVALAVPFTDHQKREDAAAAEILKLATERDTTAEERDTAKLTVEEGRETIAELAAALAVLAGESLKPCGDHDGECSGHLGPQAQDAANGALAAWRALQEGNRQAVDRISELEKLLDAAREHQDAAEELKDALKIVLLQSLLTEINAYHQDGEGALDTLRRLIRDGRDREALQKLVREADNLLCRCRNIYEHKVMGEHHFPSAEISEFARAATPLLGK